jgi:chromate transporter
VLAAGLAGFAGRWWSPRSFPASGSAVTDARSEYLVDRLLGAGALRHTRPSARKALAVTACWLAVWWLPVFAVIGVVGSDSVLAREGVFFSQAAVVTFGGAYAVLAYIAQQAVEQ